MLYTLMVTGMHLPENPADTALITVLVQGCATRDEVIDAALAAAHRSRTRVEKFGFQDAEQDKPTITNDLVTVFAYGVVS